METKRRILAGASLDATKIKAFGMGTITTIPLNRIDHELGITISAPFSSFTLNAKAKNLSLQYTIMFKTIRQGARVEVDLDVGLRSGNKILTQQRGQVPFYVDETYSGIRGTLSLIQELLIGTKLEPVLISNSTPCDIEFKAVVLRMYDGAPAFEAGESNPVSYVHSQTIPASIWLIQNPLGFKPNIITTDTAGQEFQGSVKYISGTKNIQVSFEGAFSGFAYLS